MAIESMRFLCGGEECDNENTLDDAGITADAPVMVLVDLTYLEVDRLEEEA